MKFQVKLRVTNGSKINSTVRIEVDSDRGFEVNTETLCIRLDQPVMDHSFFLKVIDGVLFVAPRPEDPGLPLNDKFVKEFPLHPGDRVQLSDISYQFLEVRKLERDSTQVKFVEIGSPREMPEPENPGRIGNLASDSDSMFSLINISSEKLPEPTKAVSEPTGTLSRSISATDASELPEIDPHQADMELPSKGIQIENNPEILPEAPKAPSEQRIRAPGESAPVRFIPQTQGAPDRPEETASPVFSLLKDCWVPALITLVASCLVGPRMGPIWVTSGHHSAFGLMVIGSAFAFVLSVAFALMIYFSAEFLEIDENFSDYFRFSALTLLAMVLPALAVPDHMKWAALLFFAVVSLAFMKFQAVFRPEGRRVIIMFGSYFSMVFLITFFGGAPHLSGAASAKPQDAIAKAKANAASADPANDEREALVRNFLEIESDLQTVDHRPNSLPVAQVVAKPSVKVVSKQAQNTVFQGSSPSLNGRSASVMDARVTGANPVSRGYSSYSGVLLARATKGGPVDYFAVAQLFTAAKAGNLAVVKEMIERKRVNPNHVTDKSVTPLMVASYSGQTDVVKYLVKKGARVNAQNKEGTTPLMFAVYGGHQDTASFLLHNGADKKKRTKRGDRALDIAKRSKNGEIVRLLGGKWETKSKVASSKKAHEKKPAKRKSGRETASKKSTKRAPAAKKKNSKPKKGKKKKTHEPRETV